ncbi:DUF6476 family protein [Tropicimonas sp. IMCC34011]|uniref:DUF6476 family protein n=1 Tax=Tropicimonas sp. IMCC34011 TaxID=2248759 RepID=UPI001E5F4B8B|nr:DUF6476 family protein [Tropicimonas sp. IMCC34011]
MDRPSLTPDSDAGEVLPAGPPPDPADLRALRWLRGLVMALLVTMILGVGTVSGLVALRLSAPSAPPAFPDSPDLPPGATPLAVTRGDGWWAVVTDDGRILILGADGTVLDEVAVALP